MLNNQILLLKLTIIPEVVDLGLLQEYIDQTLFALQLKYPLYTEIQYKIADSTNGEKIVKYFYYS